MLDHIKQKQEEIRKSISGSYNSIESNTEPVVFEKSNRYVSKEYKNGKWIYKYLNPDFYNNNVKRSAIQKQIQKLHQELQETLNDSESLEDVQFEQEASAGDYQSKYGEKWNEKWEEDGMHNHFGERMNRIDTVGSDIKEKINNLRAQSDSLKVDRHIYKEEPASFLDRYLMAEDVK